MTTYFWTFAIVPVQTYISEARRSRDLQAGSSILSFLCLRLLGFLKNHHSEVIIPELDAGLLSRADSLTIGEILNEGASGTPRYSIPNRATGYLFSESSGSPGVFANLPAQLQVEWEDLFNSLGDLPANFNLVGPAPLGQQAFDLIERYFNKGGWRTCPLQLVWAATPSSLDPEDPDWTNGLPANVCQVDDLFQKVKITRPLPQWSGKPVGKCTLCAKREALGPGEWPAARALWRKWERHKWTMKGYRTSKEERLCVQCLGRRLLGYLESQEFPSTNQIAAAHWYAKPDNQQAADKLIAEIRSIAHDPAFDPWPFVFSRGYSDKRLRDLDLYDDKPRILYARKDFESALQTEADPSDPDSYGPVWPSNYLAVIVYDGDDMGKHVSNNPRNVSKAISRFSEKLKDGLVAEYHGKAFYLGGDEGLILAPLWMAIPLAKQIRNSFVDTLGSDKTISVGISIFDHERPLGGAIEAAHAALRLAKRLDGKNGLAVSVQTASGNVWGIRAHWGAIWEFVEKCRGWIVDRDLSSGWTYQVQHLFESINPHDFSCQEDLQIVADEICRLAGRQLGRNLVGKERKEEAKVRLAELRAAFEQIRFVPPGSGHDENVNFVDLFHLISFLVREAQG